MKQRNEEEHVTVLLQVLSSYINPNDEAGDELSEDVLPQSFYDLLAHSSLLPAISSYLRNDSGNFTCDLRVFVGYLSFSFQFWIWRGTFRSIKRCYSCLEP